MTEEQKQSILLSAKKYFREIIIPAHISKLKKIKLKDFNINPFTVNYIASFLCGNTNPDSLAKALVYPRVLGTSISTSFGTHLQFFIAQVSEIVGQGSGIKGIDLEFIDEIDHRKKYCQCKAGPTTINNDDVDTISNHFDALINKALLDKMELQINDLVVGVLYGQSKSLSANYKKLGKRFTIFCGNEFWERLTGDPDFYYRLAKAFGEVVDEDKIKGKKLIDSAIDRIAKEIEIRGLL